MSPARMERVEAAVRAALTLNEAWNRGDAAALEELLHPGCVVVTAFPAPAGERLEGKNAVLDFARRDFSRGRRALRQVKEIYGMGNHAVLHWQLKPSSLDFNLPSLRGVDLVKVRAGLIIEILSYCKGAEISGNPEAPFSA